MDLIVDFNHLERCEKSIPVECSIDEQGVIFDGLNWSWLLLAIVERFIEDNRPNLDVLYKKPLYGDVVFFMEEKTNIGRCCQLSNGKWIYTNNDDAVSIIRIISRLCNHCEVSLKDVHITYLPQKAIFKPYKNPFKLTDDVEDDLEEAIEQSKSPFNFTDDIEDELQAVVKQYRSSFKLTDDVEDDLKEVIEQYKGSINHTDSVQEELKSFVKELKIKIENEKTDTGTLNNEQEEKKSSLETRDSYGRYISTKKDETETKKKSMTKSTSNKNKIVETAVVRKKDSKKAFVEQPKSTYSFTDDSEAYSEAVVVQTKTKIENEKTDTGTLNNDVDEKKRSSLKRDAHGRFITTKNDEPELIDMITSILSVHFPNGFRIDSSIELMRFRNFLVEDFNCDIDNIDDQGLIQFIVSSGTLYENKIYFVTKQTISQLMEKIEKAISSGVRTIFFTAFYSKHEAWLFSESIISEGMLKSILIELYPNYTQKENYLTINHKSNTELLKIEFEIVRVWGDYVLRNYSQIAEKLPYIPYEKIKHLMRVSSNFIRDSKETFTHISKVDITNQEHSRINDFVTKKILSDGYVLLKDIPIREITESNCELTELAVLNAVFSICLEGKYDKRGIVVTNRGDHHSALTIMKDYCREIDKCSYDNLLNYEKELTGHVRNSITLEAAYENLVRLDKNLFVSEHYVDFDHTKIDEAIALFVVDKYLPLKSFTTFATFPNCGHPWNLFLLESYCRRFSKLFHFNTPSVNSQNAGAVIYNSYFCTYIEVMADAVAKSGIAFEKTIVARFLFEKGYIGKRTSSKALEVIGKAKAIRERED